MVYRLDSALSSDVSHGFSTKADGNMSYLWGDFDTVYANRQKFAAQLNVDLDDCVFLATDHSDSIIRVGSEDRGRGVRSREDGMPADGLITNSPTIILSLLIADCLPVILLDSTNKALGLVHASWQSTDLQIVTKAIHAMHDAFGTHAQEIQAWFGPSITKRHHRFAEVIQKSLSGWTPFLHDDPDGLTAVDVVGYNRQQLLDAGVKPENIFLSNIDTAADDRFFSHYRDSRQNPDEEGRFVCMVSLVA